MDINKKISYTLSIAAVFIIALSFLLPKNEEKYLGDRFWAKKTYAPSNYDIVIIGDSRTYRGVSPSIMSESIPDKKILNFAYSNGGLNNEIFKEAESKISDKSQHKAIIIGVTANCLSGFTCGNEQYIKERKRPREDVFERLYLNGFLYQFSSVTPEQIINEFKEDTLKSYYINSYHSNGYVESTKFPKDTMEAIPYYIDDFSHFKVEQKYVDELLNQVKAWHEKGILVVGFYPPVSIPMKELEDTMGLFNEVMIRSGFINAGGKWIDVNSTEYKTYDGSHLEKESAAKLSLIVGEFIKDEL